MADARPSVTIKEESISGPVGGTATGRMAYVVISTRGAANVVRFVSTEQDLVTAIGKPNDETTSKDFHLCKSFLGYGNDLIVVRAINKATAKQARMGMNFSTTGYSVPLNAHTDTVYFERIELFNFATILGNHPGLDLAFYAKEASVDGNNISIAICKPSLPLWQDETQTIDGSTKFSDAFEFGPDATKSEIALVVLVNGIITEKHIVSFVDGNRNANNENNYIVDWMDKKSSYVWGFADGSINYSSVDSFEAIELANGNPGITPTTGDVETAYAVLSNKNEITFDYITEGTHYGNRSYIINNLCETRKDCIGFFGPKAADILNITDNNTIVTNIVADRLSLTTTSWGCYYGNWARVYDKYRDKNVWIPITAHIIGNKVRLNTNRELWVPAAGTVNGVLAGIDAIAFNPSDIQQNTLYKNGINHIVSIDGKGIVCDGQKTMTNLNVGVSRLNIRDLFRFMETFVGAAARDYLHDFNDAITRARFVGAVTPFLEDIQRRRGIVRFQVICDETNNPPAVVDNYGFRCSIKVTGNRAIENIVITFFDVPNSVDFNEVPTV